MSRATESALLPPVIAAILIFLTAGYFQNSRPGWNVNSQFALTCAIGDQGQLTIDRYHAAPDFLTHDKAFFDGHFYCDKSPVVSFLGVPFYLAYRAAHYIWGFSFSYASARYWTAWGGVGGSAAALAFMLARRLAKGTGISPATAACLSVFWIAATPLLGYSILFYSYLPACAFALGGCLLIEPMLVSKGESPIRKSYLLLGGFLLGLAAWTLQTFALLALILTLALLVRTPARRWVSLAPWAVGGLLGCSGYAIYTYSLFGEIASPYQFEATPEFKEGMSRGLMGAMWPNPLVLYLITLHPFRGLFILFPATALATIGLFVRGKKTGASPLRWIALLFFAGLLLYNSGYYMWWGGWAYAPRHLIPALPLLALGLIPWAVGKATSFIAWFFLIAGAILNVMAVSLDPQVPQMIEEELLLHVSWDTVLPTPFYELIRFVWNGVTDANWGTRMGLTGVSSILPLALLWCAGWYAMGAGRTSRKGAESRENP